MVGYSKRSACRQFAFVACASFSVACQRPHDSFVPAAAPSQGAQFSFPAEPKEPQVLVARARLKGSADLLGDHKHSVVTIAPAENPPSSDRAWITFGSEGVKRDSSLGKQVELAVSRLPDPAWSLGRTPIIASNKENQPVFRATSSAVTQLAPIQGRLKTLLALRNGSEAWLVSDISHDDLFIVGTDERRERLTVPLEHVGPIVPGLSSLGEKVCDKPRVHRIAATENEVAALLVECHREAPMRVVRWDIQTRERTVSTLPLTEPLDESELVASSRDIAVVGQTLSSRALVIFRSSQRWKVTRTGIAGKSFREALMAEDGSVWALRIGGETHGAFDWQVLQHEGRPVLVQTPSGRRLLPTRIAYDEHLGVVVKATDLETLESWLATERWSSFFPTQLP